jgi:uncharacterized membrane protein YdjX (TVP38/TMEM64 family)
VLERERAPALILRGAKTSGLARLLLVVGGWALVAGGFQLYAWHEMLTPAELVGQMVAVCRTTAPAPLLFVGAAALSPLLLVPAALLGGLAGICFGPALGILLTLIGCNLSAVVTYGLGRASHRADGRIAQLCDRYGESLRRRPFLGVLLLRLSFLPYDPVNYLVGLLRLPVGLFLLANTLGSLPGVLAIVLVGSAMGGHGDGLALPHPVMLSGAAAVMLLSIGGALALRRRTRDRP